MGHEIFGARFFGHREPAWHRLGTTFEEDDMGAADAFARGRLLYRVLKLPVVAQTPWGAVGEGDTFALVREPVDDDPEPRLFATVSKDYEVVQNADLARILEPLSRRWPVETVGALGRGERVFVTLRVGDAEVGGDHLKQFYLISDDKRGGAALSIGFVPLRVVCANTLAIALDAGDITRLTHTAGVTDTLATEAEVIAALDRARDDRLTTLAELAASPLTDDDAKGVFRAAFPDPRKPKAFRFAGVAPDGVKADLFIKERLRADRAAKDYELDAARMGLIRDAAFDLYGKFNDENPRTARTCWAALNCVTELADHRGGSGDTDQKVKDRAQATMFGYRAQEKSRAYAAVLKLRSKAPAAPLVSLPTK